MKPTQTYEDIKGFFLFKDLYDQMLQRIPTNGTWVELGVLHGRSLIYAACERKRLKRNFLLYGVDVFAKVSMGEVEGNLRDCGADEHCKLIAGTSWDVARQFGDRSIDFLFVDASHLYVHVLKDLLCWVPKMAPGSIIAGDDYGEPDHPGVKRAVDEFFPEGLVVDRHVWSYKIGEHGYEL